MTLYARARTSAEIEVAVLEELLRLSAITKARPATRPEGTNIYEIKVEVGQLEPEL